MKIKKNTTKKTFFSPPNRNVGSGVNDYVPCYDKKLIHIIINIIIIIIIIIVYYYHRHVCVRVCLCLFV